MAHLPVPTVDDLERDITMHLDWFRYYMQKWPGDGPDLPEALEHLKDAVKVASALAIKIST